VEEWSRNHRFVNKSGEELRVSVVGEILGPSMGTLVRAHGNYFAREGDNVSSFGHYPFQSLMRFQFKPIDDKSKIKDTLAIGIPTCSSTSLYNMFLNQIIAAGQVTSANADEDMRNGRVCCSSTCSFALRPHFSLSGPHREVLVEVEQGWSG
jgi:hypothetical protein